MPYYAQIDSARVCFAVTQTAGPVKAADMVEVQGLDSSLLGSMHNKQTGAWMPPASMLTPTVYTKTQFRKLLTDGENILVDNFNFAEFVAETPAIKNLTVAQRAGVRSAIARYKDAIDIDRTDLTTVEFIGALGALGLLDGPGRSAQILGGELPP